MPINEELQPTEYTPLTDWDNEPLVSDLKNDFQDASPAHDAQEAKILDWLDNLHIQGSAKRTKVKGKSSIQPKLIRKQAEWRYSALSEPFLSPDNLVTVKPLTYEDKESSIRNGQVLNYQFNHEIDKVAFIDSFIRNAVDEGTAIVRVNWELEEEEVEVEKHTYGFKTAQTKQELKLLQRLLTLKQEDPNTFELQTSDEEKHATRLTESGIPSVPVINSTETVTEVQTILSRPVLTLENYANVTIDPSCGSDYTKARFIIASFETSLDDLRRADRYTNLDEIQVSTGVPLNDPDHTSSTPSDFNIRDKNRKRFVAYEYWGRWDIHGDGTTVPIVATYVGNVMIDLRENPYPDGLAPFVFVPYLPVKDSPYGEPDGELLKDNQDIIGAITRGMVDVMARSANSQQGMRKDALDIVNKRKYNAGQDYEFNPTVDPRQAIITHTYPELPASVQVMLQNQTVEAEGMTGVRPFAGGLGGQGLGESATAVRSALDAASKRELGILRRLTSGLVKVVEKIMMMNTLFLGEEKIIEITNEEFIKVNGEELAGEFSVTIDVTSTEEDNQKAQELAFMLQTLGNNVDFSLVQLILTEISRLRKMPVLAQKIAEYQPQPDPNAVRIQELQIEQLQLENAKLQSEIIKNQATAQLDISKANTEGAKGRQLNSKADLDNLNYVEQETGVTQARDLQKHSQQANANVGLELVKAALATLTESSNSSSS